MKVYLVMGEVYYEGSFVQHIFSDKAVAEECAERLSSHPNHYRHADEYSVEEWEVENSFDQPSPSPSESR